MSFIKKHKFGLFCFIVSAILFSFTCYRALNTSITYDEALTYIKYVYSNPFKVLKFLNYKYTLANNHMLNSFLISLFQGISGKEYCLAIIRFPNLISYLIYFYFGYKLSSKYNHKYFLFLLLVLNYGTNEFFGLARGYGMCTAFIVAALYYFKMYLLDNNNLKYLVFSGSSFLLACYANTVALIIFSTYLVIVFISLIKNHKLGCFIKKYFIFLIIMILLTLLIIRYHFMVSEFDPALYGSTESFYKSVIVSIMYFYGFNSYSMIASIISLLLIMALFISNIKSNLKNELVVAPVLYFVIMIILIKATNSIWITGRCLLPTWPVIFVCIAEMYDLCKLSDIIKNRIDIIFIVLCLLLFTFNLKLNTTRQWSDNYILKDTCYQILKAKDDNMNVDDKMHGVNRYYRLKILKEYGYDIYHGGFNEWEV